MKVRPPGEVLRGARVRAGHALAALPAQLPGVRRIAVPARVLRDAPWPGSGAVVHDAVVAAAGSGATGAGAVPGQHLRGGPPVQLHQVPFGSAPVEPGMAEVVPETGAGTRSPRTGGRGGRRSGRSRSRSAPPGCPRRATAAAGS